MQPPIDHSASDEIGLLELIQSEIDAARTCVQLGRAEFQAGDRPRGENLLGQAGAYLEAATEQLAYVPATFEDEINSLRMELYIVEEAISAARLLKHESNATDGR